MDGAFRIVALVSGRGSNLQAIATEIKEGRLNAEIALVVSDNPEAKALEFCKANNIPAKYIYPGGFKTKLEGDAEAEYIRQIQEINPDLIVLAGFMRVLKSGFIKAFENKIINIHPSLLPKYQGLHTHRRALEAGDKEAGATVHFVNEIVDGGKPIIQAKVPVLPDDNEETLAARVLKEEHRILPEAIRIVISKSAE
jgi:phosphoribosylglycinamide formyltransferase-1